ncbi:MAG: OprO/OprP family phosphate-selective porin [Lentisphaerae bacterium]|nr:OprO/OprP family phosphate-selective porin [Lentisphaerota bacterium]
MKGIQQIIRRAALIGGLLAAGTHQAAAQAPQPSLEQLDQKVRILERKLEIQEEEAARKKLENPALTAGKDGFALTSADKAFQLKLRGYVQADGRFFLSDDDEKATDSFLLRRVRPIWEGKLYNDFDFRIMPDFGNGSTVLQDAYLGYTASPAAKLRAGKFKPPFGLERLQSGTDTLFIERAHPTSLGPNRDVGLQLGGDVMGSTVNYAVGVFNGVTDGGSGDGDSNDGKDVVGRVFVTPFKNSDIAALSGLSLGLAASAGDQQGTTTVPGLPAFRSIGQQSFYTYKTSTNAADAVIADGSRVRVSPQAVYYYRAFGLLAEYAQSSQDVTKGARSDTLDNDALLVELSYVLTGEEATYKGVTPAHPFDPKGGTWGAFEVALRYSELNVDDDAFPTYADAKKSAKGTQTVGVGLNWYLNRNLKAQVNVDNSTFDGGAADGDRDDEQALFTRLQISF